jgi:hypothetical protein
VVVLAVALVGCASPSTQRADSPPPQDGRVVEERPERFTIAPDDYHVPYAGTAEDGRKFFLSEELFEPGGAAYVGLFLWKADGTFDEVVVEEVSRPRGLPPGQAGRAGAKAIVDARLNALGDYVLEPVEVEPFTKKIDGVTFGWKVGQYDDGSYYINIEPGNFIAYYAPWDGLGYDT